MSNLNDDMTKQSPAGREGLQDKDKLQKISEDIDAIANKLELIDNSFSDYVYSDPVYPEINLDEVLDKLEALNQDMKKEVADLPGISQSLGKMNMHFYTVVQHLNRITDKIILFEEELGIIKKTVTLLAEHIAAESKKSPDRNPNENSDGNQKEASEELLNKITDLSAKLSKLELNIYDLLNSSLTSMKTDIERRLDSMEQNISKNRALTVGIIISILLNIVVIAMQFI